MKKSVILALAVLLLAAAASLSAAAAPQRADGTEATPGVTRTSIKIGGTFPLRGVASIYAPIARGMPCRLGGRRTAGRVPGAPRKALT